MGLLHTRQMPCLPSCHSIPSNHIYTHLLHRHTDIHIRTHMHHICTHISLGEMGLGKSLFEDPVWMLGFILCPPTCQPCYSSLAQSQDPPPSFSSSLSLSCCSPTLINSIFLFICLLLRDHYVAPTLGQLLSVSLQPLFPHVHVAVSHACPCPGENLCSGTPRLSGQVGFTHN